MRVENFSGTEPSSVPRIEAPVAINGEGEPWNKREIIEAALAAAKLEELVGSPKPVREQHRAEINALNERLTKAQEEE
jgi:hypothetical protein